MRRRKLTLSEARALLWRDLITTPHQWERAGDAALCAWICVRCGAGVSNLESVGTEVYELVDGRCLPLVGEGMTAEHAERAARAFAQTYHPDAPPLRFWRWHYHLDFLLAICERLEEDEPNAVVQAARVYLAARLAFLRTDVPPPGEVAGSAWEARYNEADAALRRVQRLALQTRE